MSNTNQILVLLEKGMSTEKKLDFISNKRNFNGGYKNFLKKCLKISRKMHLRRQDFGNFSHVLTNGDKSGVDHQVHSEGSQHNIRGEQAGTMEGASNANASLDAVKSNTDEGQGLSFDTVVAGMSQQVLLGA